MNRLENVTLDKDNPKFHTDIPRLREGGVGAQVGFFERQQLRRPEIEPRPHRLRE